MKRTAFASLLVGVLALALSMPSFAQDAAKKEMKKEMKSEMHKGTMVMSVSCDPDCGFMVRSHDEKELISMVKDHAKKHHNKEVTDKDVMGMMKMEDSKMEDMKMKEEKK